MEIVNGDCEWRLLIGNDTLYIVLYLYTFVRNR